MNLEDFQAQQAQSQRYMVYADYQKSALKHLKTCEYMLENLHKMTENDIMNNLFDNQSGQVTNQTKEERENHILREVYYLLGYVLEGTINYCIYKELNFPQNQNVEFLDEPYNRSRGICFRLPEPNTSNLWYDYFISNHNYTKNIEMLERRSNGINTFMSNLRSFNINMDPVSYKNYQLFRNWEVKQRYQTDNTNFNPNQNLAYNKTEITEFLFFVYYIYRKLPTL